MKIFETPTAAHVKVIENFIFDLFRNDINEDHIEMIIEDIINSADDINMMKHEHTIKNPQGLIGRMFKTLHYKINLMIKDNVIYGNIGYNYEHPDGGRNGYDLRLKQDGENLIAI